MGRIGSILVLVLALLGVSVASEAQVICRRALGGGIICERAP